MCGLTAEYYFPCAVYTVDKPEFLQRVNQVSEEYLSHARSLSQLDEIYPVYMSPTYHEDHRLFDFTQFIRTAAMEVLDSQGYNMSSFDVHFSEMWTQEHYRHSSMEQHVHGYGVSLVGFYFLETPEDCSKIVFHDPRAGKIMTDLPEKDASVVTLASQAINFTPRPGLMMLTNSWLAHSFSRHRPEQPIKFVHFNLFVRPAAREATVI